MADEILVKYKLDMSQAEAEVKDFEKELKTTESVGKKSFSTISNESKKSAQAISNTSTQVDTLGSKLSSLADNLPFAGQAKQVLELGSALTSSGNAAKGASVGVRVFSTALLSTGIPILIAAIAGLIAYFKRTDEGATRLAGVFSAFNATLDLVTGSVIGFGEAIFKSFKSTEDFKAGLSDLGDFIVNNMFNRVKGFITLWESLSLAVGGDFEKAGLRFLDATTQIATGVTDITSKTSEFIKEAEAAALAAYEWEKAMDALQDKMREDSTTIAENDRAITKLIIASKNKQIEDEKALGFLDQASKLEKQNLAITLQNETAKLRLLQERNKRESDSINQDIKAGQTRRSINDDLAQEERDQINKLIQLQQSSDNLLEKIQNRRDAKEEEIFQNQIKRIAAEETLKENAAKEDYINGVTNAKQFEDAVYQIKLQGLQNQKELLVSNSRDIVDIDKAILDLQLANLDKHNKEAAALKKKANDDFLAMVEARLKEEDAIADKAQKDKDQKDKEHDAKVLAIKQAGFETLDTLASGFADISAQKKQMELDEELSKSEKETDQKTKDLQKQFDNGLITEEQFNAKKLALDQKQANKESEIKKKKFEADKKAALIQVAIDTALAIAKAFAQLGPIAGPLGAALAAAMGIAQAALIASKPTPKFKDGVINLKGPGTGTSDSIPSMLSRGESVMTAKETQQYMGPLEAMRENTFEDYVNDHFVSPALEAMNRKAFTRREKKQSEAARRLEMLSGGVTDMSETNRLLKKNGNVRLSNINELAKVIAKENYFNSKIFR
jgi:hypothetical protein